MPIKVVLSIIYDDFVSFRLIRREICDAEIISLASGEPLHPGSARHDLPPIPTYPIQFLFLLFTLKMDLDRW
jgi:hypothetical protein